MKNEVKCSIKNTKTKVRLELIKKYYGILRFEVIYLREKIIFFFEVEEILEIEQEIIKLINKGVNSKKDLLTKKVKIKFFKLNDLNLDIKSSYLPPSLYISSIIRRLNLIGQYFLFKFFTFKIEMLCQIKFQVKRRLKILNYGV
jgi:hypothetical protein